ncbi:cyclin-D2-1-like [Amaranthus tricolor]|uniref:cyclin-D2-1-like n=1 Tax=Amaranthus tricolor TaxID=29722 RepID=UPI002590FBC0|nr:cyclin-D2-1-like [Amaranthus tricolor]
MAPSIDYEVSSLLCAEDNTSVFDEEVDNNSNYYNGNDFEICIGNPKYSFHYQDYNFLNGNGPNFSVPSDECLASMFDKEIHSYLGFDYLKRFNNGDLSLTSRNQAVLWILKVQSHYNFGPLCAYLSVNYLDRFLSAYELPKGKYWMMQLLAVACLSLGAKVDETDVPLSLDFQVFDRKFVFEAKTIQRMELLVLSTLKWRMQSVTPFSFIDYFLYKLSGDVMPPKSLILQAIQLILSTIKEIELMEFKPSIIAAAVAISVTQDTQIVELTHKAFCLLIDHVEKEKVIKCIEKMRDMRMISKCNGWSGALSVPQSPVGVLDAPCLSYTSTPSVSCANSHCSPAPPPKRRKLNGAV